MSAWLWINYNDRASGHELVMNDPLGSSRELRGISVGLVDDDDEDPDLADAPYWLTR